MDSDVGLGACPVHVARDDRKSAAIALKNTRPEQGARVAGTYGLSREILRSPKMKQGGAGADQAVMDNPEHMSFFFLDGEPHRRRRAAVAGYFGPKAIVTRYHAVIQQTMDMLIADLQATGPKPLDQLSFQMAVDVASEILGLTNSDSRHLARRVRATLNTSMAKRGSGRVGRWLQLGLAAYQAWNFYRNDLAPAIKARRLSPKEDVISYMLREGYSKKAMIIECLTYGAAGMLTTREFIVMSAWHLFENNELRQRYLDGGESAQFAILDEIVRLEPVAAMLHRRAVTDIPDGPLGPVKEGDLFAIDIRAANTDEAITGPCPYALDPDRTKRMKVMGSYMSFGDGAHRCPGSQVALHETRIFLDRLLRVPGIEMLQEPTIHWNDGLGSYELRGAMVSCA